jgi:hypothetical protein
MDHYNQIYWQHFRSLAPSRESPLGCVEMTCFKLLLKDNVFFFFFFFYFGGLLCIYFLYFCCCTCPMILQWVKCIFSFFNCIETFDWVVHLSTLLFLFQISEYLLIFSPPPPPPQKKGACQCLSFQHAVHLMRLSFHSFLQLSSSFFLPSCFPCSLGHPSHFHVSPNFQFQLPCWTPFMSIDILLLMGTCMNNWESGTPNFFFFLKKNNYFKLN